MGLVYITGVAGMGKTSVFNELLSRGIEAYGVDEHDLADWINTETGASDLWPRPEPIDFDAHEWYKHHRYMLSHKKLRILKAKADKYGLNIYIVGTTDDLDDCRGLFDKIIALHMNDIVELRRRILARTGVEFGKTDEEFERVKKSVQSAPGQYRKINAQIIDASLPISAVADKILK